MITMTLSLLTSSYQARQTFYGLDVEKSNALLHYLGGDEKIEFKVKEQLYRLWRNDDAGNTVYMNFSYGTPNYYSNKDFAFKAPLEEIKKWVNPAWEIEKVE